MKTKSMSSRHCLVDGRDCRDSLDSEDKLINQSINKKTGSGWDEAISDAKKLIAEASQRITDLSLGIKEFKRRRDAGEPWPGTNALSDHAPLPTASAFHRDLEAE